MFAAAATNTSSDRGLAREITRARARLAAQDRQILELNHRIANSLQLAANLLMFEQLRAHDAGAVAALEASRARLLAVGEVHRHMSGLTGETAVELRPFLAGLCDAIGVATGLRCVTQVDASRVDGETAQRLAIALNEIAINAAKHAYDGPGGRLDVICRREAGELVLTVADHGKGLGEGRRPGGLGMSILAAIVRELGGTLTARDDHGATFTLRAPLPGAPAPVIDRSFEAWSRD